MSGATRCRCHVRMSVAPRWQCHNTMGAHIDGDPSPQLPVAHPPNPPSIRAFSVIPPYEFRLDIAKRVATLTFVYVMMLAFNNLCLQYVEVTFYQVARSLTIVFNIIFTYYILGHTTNTQTLFACAIVTLGFALGSYGEINFSWAGVLFGVGSSVFVALYGIYVKKTLAYVENDQWRLLHYNTTIAIIMLFPLVVVSGEFSDMMDSVTFWYDTTFWSVMILTGLTGFLINIATFLQIKFTSPLTNTISGTAKACAQTIIAAVVIQNPISSMNGTGIFLSLGGSAYYSYVRYREMMDRR
ncbi:GDP-fucose transporter [Gonapodya prolifera JEL478]|uniref:GDP-fucose transporter n=1 Tax=Gonapodya prolifera (strain JEL478) TaxID=1344416 RepID=A0A139ARH8_GONPJ|nr:GDP-fucose transporter [Gonapodya prolifera JEL478]|eukprot:KXS19332.1 GDP-fucose transporter [Gonapodya prolifera JEL478]